MSLFRLNNFLSHAYWTAYWPNYNQNFQLKVVFLFQSSPVIPVYKNDHFQKRLTTLSGSYCRFRAVHFKLIKINYSDF